MAIFTEEVSKKRNKKFIIDRWFFHLGTEEAEEILDLAKLGNDQWKEHVDVVKLLEIDDSIRWHDLENKLLNKRKYETMNFRLAIGILIFTVFVGTVVAYISS